MIMRTCVMILAAALLCCSAQAQSILLDRGEQGPFFQAGYIGSSGVNSYELDFGYALSDRIDFGGGIVHSDIGRYGSPHDSKSVTSGGQFADIYPLKFGSGKFTLLLGLHESYSKAFAGNETAWLALGTSLNLKLAVSRKVGSVFTAGFSRAQSSAVERDLAVYGVSFVADDQRINKLSLFFEATTGSGTEAYSVGLGYTWVLRHR